MKRDIISCITCIALILTGCSGGEQSGNRDSTNSESETPDNSYIHEDIGKQSVEIDFDKAIPVTGNLKTAGNISFDESDDNILGIPHHIVVKGDTIYAVDPVKSPGIYAYHKNGQQIFAYCPNGDGPEDISRPMNLTVREDDIVVFDFGKKRLLYFSKHGDFIKSIELPINALSAAMDPVQGIYIDYSNQAYDNTKLAWIKDSVSAERKILDVPEFLSGMTVLPMATLLNISNNELRYYPPLETEIYNIIEGKAYVIYELDFKGKWPSRENITDQFSGNDWARKMRSFPINSKGFSENEKWLVIGYVYDQKLYIVVFNKSTKESKTYVDTENKYYNPLYVDESDLYMQRKDDTLDILEL